MFFDLTTNEKENFTLHFKLPNGLVLNTDDGWESFESSDCTVILKGYSNLYNLKELSSHLTDCKRTSIKGNFCAFVCKGDKVTLLHDKDRGFPVWIGDNTITNLVEQPTPVWEDCNLTVDGSMNVTKHWGSPYVFKKQELSDDQIIGKIDNILSETFEKFLSHNDKPIKIYLSGGVDTLLAWSYLDSFTKNYEIVDYEYMKYTYFFSVNRKKLARHQLYNQIHLWEHPCVLVTGSCGDEYFMRGPYTTAQCLKYHGHDLLKSTKHTDYMYKFFNRKKCSDGMSDGMDSVKPSQSLEDVYTNILNRNKNDYQHWHLENTMTFTPFKDTSITETILQSSVEQLISNAQDATIQNKLIEKLDPRKLKFRSKWKNYTDEDSIRSFHNKMRQLLNELHSDEEQ